MIKLLDSASKKTIAFEIIDGYETTDKKSIEKLLDEKLALRSCLKFILQFYYVSFLVVKKQVGLRDILT